MALPVQTLNIDVLDPNKTGLYESFSGTDRIVAPMVVRENGWYLAIQAMQDNTSGIQPWTSVDLSAATISVAIDNPDLFPSQGLFYASYQAVNTSNLESNIGSTNLALALNALSTIISAGGITVVQSGVDFIITFNSNGARSLISALSISLYPASTITVIEDQAGTSTAPSIQILRIQQLPATFQSTFTPVGTTMQGELNLATPGMVARFDALPDAASFSAFLEITVQFLGQDPQTILLVPVTVLRNVIRNGAIVQPPFPMAATTTYVNTAIASAQLLDVKIANNGSDFSNVAATQQTLLNSISSIHGSLIFRGATAWTSLSPGTSGQILKTNGASASPSWTNNTSGVISFNGRIGAVTLIATDVTSLGTLNMNINGTASSAVQAGILVGTDIGFGQIQADSVGPIFDDNKISSFSGTTYFDDSGFYGNGSHITGLSGGTVTSIAATVPSILSVSGSPITTSGTLAFGLVNQAANKILSGPTSGGVAVPTFRSLVVADIPTLNQNTTGSSVNFTGSLVGDVTGTQGSTIVGKINGTSLAGLATGILKNTTTTGIPSVAVSGTDYAPATIWVTKTSAYTLVVGDKIAANSTGGIFTLTLPTASGSLKQIDILDPQASWASNNITLSGTVNGVTNAILNIAGASVRLVDVGGTAGWRTN